VASANSGLTAALAVATALASAGTARAEGDNAAILRGLDKITARVGLIEAPIGAPVAFGRLTITARACVKRPPEETAEVTAFLEILEQPPGVSQPVMRFTGWMFASTPALSALDHPVYDVTVIDCRMVSGDGSRPKQ